MRVADINTFREYQKRVAVIVDEMHVKDDLVYDKHTGSLNGFANLGDSSCMLSSVGEVVQTKKNVGLLQKTGSVFGTATQTPCLSRNECGRKCGWALHHLQLQLRLRSHIPPAYAQPSKTDQRADHQQVYRLQIERMETAIR